MSLLIYDKLKSSEEIIEGTQDEFSISEDNFNNLSETLKKIIRQLMNLTLF